MADLRYRVALRAYLANPTEQNALAAFAAAIRAGVIDIGAEQESVFGDWGIAHAPKAIYRGLSIEAQLWIIENDLDLMRNQRVIDVNQEIDGEDVTEPPQELLDLMDAAGKDGFEFIAFE